MQVLERPSLNLELATRADRKLRRYGSNLDNILSIIIRTHGMPDFVANVPDPLPMDPADPRLDAAVSLAKVKRDATDRTVVVPHHRHPLAVGTLLSIYRQAGMR